MDCDNCKNIADCLFVEEGRTKATCEYFITKSNVHGAASGLSCQHTQTRLMVWPDGGESMVCKSCLKTRHVEMHTTEWQDHGYKTIADWYAEAEALQRKIDRVLAR